MPRIKVTRLRKFCGQLAGHSWRRAERVARAAAELVRKWLPSDQDQITLLDFQLYLAEGLEAHRKNLTAADNMHLHELQVSRNVRQERDAATAQVREGMLQLRDSLDGLFGPGGGGKIFEDAPSIPTDPVALAQFTGHVLDNLGNEDFEMPTPLQKGFSLDRKQAVADLEGPHQRLDTALRRLESAESDSKFSQTRKDDQIGASEVFAFRVARFYEAFYDLVGLDGLSDRVRRSSHRAISGSEDVTQEGNGDAGEVPEPASEPGVDASEPGAVSEPGGTAGTASG